MKDKLQSLKPYKNRLIGGGIGLAIGILLLTLGFWRTLVLVLATGLCWLAGAWMDGALPEKFTGIIRNWLRW